MALLAAPVSAQPTKGEDESAAFVDEGRAALLKNQLDDAAKALDQAITLNPRRVDAYVLRAAVYAARKQYKDGIALMRKVQPLAPNDPEVLVALGSQLVLSGDTAAGVPMLQGVVATNPARYDAQILLGRYAHDAGKWPDSIAAYEAYFTSRPAALAKEDPRHRVELADAYLRYNAPAKALALFQQGRATDLRAKIGIAWATAAIDCRKARPLLKELEIHAEQIPAIWLVDGRCALALGDSNAALAQGTRYLKKVEDGSAAGHALVGEAYAVKGNLPEAKKELELARAAEPDRRRWTVRLAHVVRRAGDTPAALAALEKLGPPASAAIDPDWWRELGEALLAKGDAAGVVTRISPIVVELAGDAQIRTVLGAAQLASGQPDAAIKTLEDAERIASTPRSKKLLGEALAQVGIQKLKDDSGGSGGNPRDLIEGAEALLARAAELDGNAVVWRNLGLARMLRGKPADAVGVLDRATKADGSATTLLLAARAHAEAKDVAGATPLYERAFAAAGREKSAELVYEVVLDWAATELATGDAAQTVAILEKAAATKAPDKLGARYKAALADARHAAGLAQLRVGNASKAVELLKLASVDGTLATKCDLAVATVASDNPGAAAVALRAIAGQSCPFPPPADTQAAPILVAFTEGLNSKRAAKSLEKLTSLSGKSTGAAAVLLNTSIRVVALNAAQDAYRNGASGLPQVRKFLATARSANTRVGADEVAHNNAVLDLADGRLDTAIDQLERVAAKIPEALVNLGIAWERKGEPQKALDAWRRAKRANMHLRYPVLNDWIESKERIYGGAE